MATTLQKYLAGGSKRQTTLGRYINQAYGEEAETSRQKVRDYLAERDKAYQKQWQKQAAIEKAMAESEKYAKEAEKYNKIASILGFPVEVGKAFTGTTAAVGADVLNLLTPWKKPEEKIKSVKMFGNEYITPSERGTRAGTLTRKGEYKKAAGELGTAALDIVSTFYMPAKGLNILKGAGVLKAMAQGIVTGAQVGGLYGLTGGLQQGQSWKDVGKSTAYGTGAGAIGGGLFGGLLAGAGRATEKVLGGLRKPTVTDDVLAATSKMSKKPTTDVVLEATGFKTRPIQVPEGMKAPKIPAKIAKLTAPKAATAKPKVSKPEPLIQEARKYKSAEEFVKAQGKPLLHGGPESITEFKYAGKRGVGGVYLTPDTGMAKTFSGKEGQITEAYVKPKKVFKIKKGSDQYAGSGGMGDDILIEAPHNYPDEIKRIKAEGYDAIQSSDGKQLLVLDPSQIKTKSQLTDIWNKSQPLQEAGVKVVPAKVTAPETGEVKVSQFAKRLNEELPDNLKIDENYTTTTLKKEAADAAELLEKDPQKLVKIANGEIASDANTQTAALVVLKNKAVQEGDMSTAAALLNKRRLANTRRGQEIAMEKLSVRMNPEEQFIGDLINTRIANVKTGVAGLLEKMKKGGKTKNRIVADKIKVDAGALANDLKLSVKIKQAQEVFNSLICK